MQCVIKKFGRASYRSELIKCLTSNYISITEVLYLQIRVQCSVMDYIPIRHKKLVSTRKQNIIEDAIRTNIFSGIAFQVEGIAHAGRA